MLDTIVAEVERSGTVEVESGYCVVCVVGEGLRESTGLASSVFSTIQDTNISLISHGASSVNLTFVSRKSRGHTAAASDGCIRGSFDNNGPIRTNEGPDEYPLDFRRRGGRWVSILRDYLESLGWTVELQPVSERQNNVIAYLNDSPRVWLSTHMDTVPPFIPPPEDDEKIYGRGSSDAKGIIAAQITAAERLARVGVRTLASCTPSRKSGHRPVQRLLTTIRLRQSANT